MLINRIDHAKIYIYIYLEHRYTIRQTSLNTLKKTHKHIFRQKYHKVRKSIIPCKKGRNIMIFKK